MRRTPPFFTYGSSPESLLKNMRVRIILLIFFFRLFHRTPIFLHFISLMPVHSPFQNCIEDEKNDQPNKERRNENVKQFARIPKQERRQSDNRQTDDHIKKRLGTSSRQSSLLLKFKNAPPRYTSLP